VAGAATASWSGTNGQHAVLAMALALLIIELNLGVTQTFAAGNVILLEDVFLLGHQMKLVSGDLKVLFLTLPQTHYHMGKDHVALNTVVQQQQ